MEFLFITYKFKIVFKTLDKLLKGNKNILSSLRSKQVANKYFYISYKLQ